MRSMLNALAATVVVLVWVVAAQAAPTVATFDIGDTVFTPLQSGSAPGVTFGSPGISNGYLRLARTVNSQGNTIAFNRTSSGAFSDLILDFDFRIGPNADAGAANSTGADGMAVALLNTGVWGTTGAGPSFSEDPNIASSLAIGFDTWNNGAADGDNSNHVSLHVNGAQVAQFNLDEVNDLELENNAFNHVHARVTPTGGGSNVTLQITDGTDGSVSTLLNNTFVSGLDPYEGRLAFGARTGGANNNHDIDNLVASFGGSSGQTKGSFDYGMTSEMFNLVGGEAEPHLISEPGRGQVLRLTTDGVGSQANAIAFDRTHVGPFEEISANFDFRISPAGNPAANDRADGFSFVLADTSIFGTSGVPGNLNVTSEEPNLAGSLGVAFDTWDNGGGEGNDVSLHWNGSLLSSVEVGPDLALENDVFNNVSIFVAPRADGSGSDVTVQIVDGTDGSVTTPFNNFFVAGLVPYESRLAFLGRTGGAFENVDLDNILVNYQPVIPEPVTMTGAALGLLALAGWRRRRSV